MRICKGAFEVLTAILSVGIEHPLIGLELQEKVRPVSDLDSIVEFAFDQAVGAFYIGLVCSSPGGMRLCLRSLYRKYS